MIVLLSCSMSCYGGSSTNILPTGDVEPTDSVLVSYNDIRKANAKLVELDYVKQENTKLREICVLDSTAISALKAQVTRCNRKLKSRNRTSTVLSIVAAIELIVILFK